MCPVIWQTPEPPAVQILTREIVLNLRLKCMEIVGNEQAPPDLSLINYGALGPGSIYPDLRSSLGIPNPPDFPGPPDFRVGESVSLLSLYVLYIYMCIYIIIFAAKFA